MKMKSKPPTVNMDVFRTELLELLRKHSGRLDSSEMLALLAYTIGQMIAMMDARVWNSEMIMAMISKNIETGNQHAIENAADWMGKA